MLTEQDLPLYLQDKPTWLRIGRLHLSLGQYLMAIAVAFLGWLVAVPLTGTPLLKHPITAHDQLLLLVGVVVGAGSILAYTLYLFIDKERSRKEVLQLDSVQELKATLLAGGTRAPLPEPLIYSARTSYAIDTARISFGGRPKHGQRYLWALDIKLGQYLLSRNAWPSYEEFEEARLSGA